ncbi:hypothetical protein C463_04174 [Halorubrum californiense DSM 19288]|uniref:Uncharacterized protein n=1 Tax=Halorubrum californiense DSM 19288 TaxID=1227465 RepID=M0EHJ7_9EURY|nr:hypothetical protein C463_04174 [Halorubrum californiense DSM 19288]
MIQCHHLVGLPTAVGPIENVRATRVIARQRIPKNGQGLSKPLRHQRAIKEELGVRLEFVLVIHVVEFYLPVYLSIFPKLTAEGNRVFESLGQGVYFRHLLLLIHAATEQINTMVIGWLN